MAQRGRKKGCTDAQAVILRQELYVAFDKLRREERLADATRASYLPRAYYIDKLFNMHIAPWSKSRICRLLTYRSVYDNE